MPTQQPLPQPTFPLVDADGRINDVWYQFLSALFARTGGNLGMTPGGSTTPPGYAQLQSTVSSLSAKVPLLQAAVADQDVLSAAEVITLQSQGVSSEQIATLQASLADLQLQIAYQAEDFA